MAMEGLLLADIGASPVQEQAAQYFYAMSEQPDRWEGFLTNVGQGVALVLIAMAIIVLYKGRHDKPIWPL